VTWPGAEWTIEQPAADIDREALDAAIGKLCTSSDAVGDTHALVLIHRGRLVAERYGALPDTVFGPGKVVDADTPLISWSMAKSVTHALVGFCVMDGLLDVSDPASVPQWAGDERSTITLQQLLEMRPGLEFLEDYVDAGVSHVIEMLFGSGKDDVAAYAAAFPLIHKPGTVWNYSSGTTNIVARIVGDAVGGGEQGMRTFMSERLFEPIGMTSADPRFDPAGTFIGSSFVYATARDFARFGYLYLRDGMWEGRRLLPEGWMEHARSQVPVPDGEPYGYGAHWWVWPEERGSLACHGFEGQRIVVLPERDLVVVRLGKTVEAQRAELHDGLRAIFACFPEARKTP